MEYVKINGKEYPATIRGYISDKDWDKRDSMAITLEISYEEALSTFVDGASWSIIHWDEYTNKQGERVLGDPIEYDNSDYSVAGDVTDHRNGFVTVKMGKPLETEIQQEQLAMASIEINNLQNQLANAITEEELSTAYTEGVNSL